MISINLKNYLLAYLELSELESRHQDVYDKPMEDCLEKLDEFWVQLTAEEIVTVNKLFGSKDIYATVVNFLG